MKDDISEIKKTLKDFIEKADDKYAHRDDFVFWRNLLVSGMLLTIFLGALSVFLGRMI